jgi:hypothetical protein
MHRFLKILACGFLILGLAQSAKAQGPVGNYPAGGNRWNNSWNNRWSNPTNNAQNTRFDSPWNSGWRYRARGYGDPWYGGIDPSQQYQRQWNQNYNNGMWLRPGPDPWLFQWPGAMYGY